MDIQQFFLYGMDRVIPAAVSPPSGIHLNIGAGNKLFPGAFPLDWPEWDADKDPIPFDDESVSFIHCYHFLEHVKSPVAILQEMQRVLAPGGIVNIIVPYYNSQLQGQDLDHKSVFCETTWNILFRNKYYSKNKIEWKFRVGINIIIGIVERNMCLMTQLIKE